MRALVAAWAVFVIGGLLSGWGALHTLQELGRPRTATTHVVADVSSAARPSPASQPLARAPSPRDARDALPPFEAAGQADPAPTPQPSSPAGRLSILLLGIDQRPDQTVPGGDPGRTDSMLLVSIDFDAHTASMVSIPRDGFVVIPGYGNERINAAYSFGELEQPGRGPELAKRTVASVFGVPVDRVALVDVHAMEQIIDTLGGVWIDNPQRLVDPQYPTDDYRTIVVDIPAGRQLMRGVTAVEYARMRHPDSDYGRQARQQQLLLALRDQALHLDTLPRLPQLIPQVLSLVHTDLSPVDIGHLVAFGRGLARDRDVLTLPPDPQLTPSYTGPGGAAYVNLTPAYRAAVKELIEQPRVAAERADIAVYNAGAPVGSGSRAAALLGQIGLSVDTIELAPRVAASRIEAGAGARATATAVAQVLGLPTDALVFVGDSSSVRILLGPDLTLPTG